MNYYIPLNLTDYKKYKYDPRSDYYNDECNLFTTENKTDILIRDRKNYFNKNNLSLCEEMCTFIEYVEEKQIVRCECKIKNKFNSFMNVNVSKYNLVHRFDIKNKRLHNFWVIKCYRLIFTMDIITSNLFSQIILGIIFFHFIGVFVYYIFGQNILYDKIKIMLVKTSKFRTNFLKKKNLNINKEKINFSYLKKKEPPKRKSSKISKKINIPNYKLPFSSNRKINKNITTKNLTNFVKKTKNVKTAKNKDFRDKSENELNSLSYYDAIIEDKRSFIQIYFSFLKTNQILFFAFNPKNDYNSRIIKICFIFFTFALLIFFNTAFIIDNVIYNIYISNGIWKLGNTYIYIICTTLITCIVKNILIEVIFTESDVLSIKYTFNEIKIKNILGIVVLKCVLFFGFGILCLAGIWLYVACFFTVFANTKHYAVMNMIISFGSFLVVPIIFYIFPALIRTISLSNRKKKNKLYLYILSKVLLILI